MTTVLFNDCSELELERKKSGSKSRPSCLWKTVSRTLPEQFWRNMRKLEFPKGKRNRPGEIKSVAAFAPFYPV